MAIVATEITSILGDTKRIISYRCQDHLGQWHECGPVISSDPDFDEDAFKTVMAEKMAIHLAENEFNATIGGME